MATSLSSLLTQLRSEIRLDRNDKIWAQDIKTSFLNQAYFQVQKDMGFRLRFGQTSYSFQTTPGVQEYALPSDFLMARLVTYNGDPLNLIEYEELKAQNLGDTSGIPHEYYIYGDNIGFNAVPNATGTIVLYYRKRLATLSSSQNTELPIDFDLPIVKYAAYLLWSTPRGNRQTAQEKVTDYKQAMDTMFAMYALESQGALTFRLQRRRRNYGSTARNLT